VKKILVLLIFVPALVLAMVVVASADGGPHGGYTPTTDACAGCHRAHTARGPRLLITPIETLCMSCHGTAGTGADTNVEDGVYLERDGFAEVPAQGVVDRGLRGGGFVNTRMNTLGGAALPAAATSGHTYDGTPGTVWGNGAIGSGAGGTINLECTGCHDPHGNGNYRILRPVPIDSGAAGPINVTDEAANNYTVASASEQYFGEGYDLAAGSTTPMSVQYRELSDWCAQCHTRYMAPTEGATTDSGDPIFTYRHMTANTAVGGDCSKCHSGAPSAATAFITFNANYWNHDVECMTCHVAHGSSADMTTDGPYSGTVPWPDGAALPDGDARSVLLRIDGRGVCQACHNKPGTPTP
jgi:predicted CXXCH cytochrome family protein